jgi:hypothetical protein
LVLAEELVTLHCRHGHEMKCRASGAENVVEKMKEK